MRLHRRAARHAVNGGLRLLAVMLALMALAVPAYAYWESTRPPGIELAEQIEVPLPAQPATLAGGMPSYEDGVIALSYHNISWDDRDLYAVTPRAFAAQMGALKAAGFETISLEEFSAYVHGKPVDLPVRALLITFDDGTKTNWIYGDPVLRELGFEATNFLITADVSHHQPYYLSWPEVEEMAESGRWSFGTHTDDGHGYVPVNHGTGEGPFLTNRAWLPAQGRRETVAEYTARVVGDAQRSIERIENHGLPRPVGFAFPFSATEASNDPTIGPRLRRILLGRFDLLVDNRIENTMLRAGMPSPLSRVEVFQTTSTRQLLESMRNTIQRNETGFEAADASEPAGP